MDAVHNSEVDGRSTESSNFEESVSLINEASDTTRDEDDVQETSGYRSDGEDREVIAGDTTEHPFSKKTWREDLTLVVEGKNLHVSKVILGMASPVFNEVLEKGPIHIMELPAEMSYRSAVEFLLWLYPNTHKSVNKNNLHEVMGLAFHYEVDVLKQECVACLKETVNLDTPCDVLLKLIQVCQVHGLKSSEDICWEAVGEKSFEDIDELDTKATQSNLSARIRKIRSEKIQQLEIGYEREKQNNVSLNAVYRYLLSCMDPSERKELESFLGGRFCTVTVDFRFVDTTMERVQVLKTTADELKISLKIKREQFNNASLHVYVSVNPATVTPLKMQGQIVLINRVDSTQNHSVNFSGRLSGNNEFIEKELIELRAFRNTTSVYLVQSVGTLEIRFISIGC